MQICFMCFVNVVIALAYDARHYGGLKCPPIFLTVSQLIQFMASPHNLNQEQGGCYFGQVLKAIEHKI